jgi:hypothetical protein
VIFRFVDIGGIVDHHFLEVIVRFVDISRIFFQSPLNSDGQEFHQYQENELSPLSSDGQQFHYMKKTNNHF